MQYRYSRGQPGQGSLPRPAWGSGSGSHGARTASPEPGGISTGNAGALGSGATIDQPKGTPQDEVILQLEHELNELRNHLAWKDQRIAELSRTDTPAARLKRDIRHLASELHRTRKELSESVREAQDLRAQLERGEANGSGRDGAQRDIVDSPSAATTGNAGGNANNAGRASAPGGDRGTQLRGRIVELEEENRQLRETVVQLNQMKAPSLNDQQHQSHVRQPSGASTQRAAEPPPSALQPLSSGSSGTTGSSFTGTHAARQPYMNQQAATLPAVAANTSAVSTPSVAPTTSMVVQEEPVRPTVYSSQNMEHTTTIGPTTLQGVGTVDGVAMVAKVLLQRIGSSVCAAHRRPQQTMGAPHAPGQLGSMMMHQMPMT
mmetsp:Transcript_32791/g.52309  ORF Transcript_32791/g.52309 Transcript_32791/m.52309 type:complete len:376 (+) Transcript_32791:40-1167(+)